MKNWFSILLNVQYLKFNWKLNYKYLLYMPNTQYKINTMRDHMSTIATYSGNLKNMDPMNDSVIVCTPTSPDAKKFANRRIKKGKYSNNQFESVKFRNLKENSLVNQMRIPLRTVYESPLDHSKRNPCNANSSVVINLAAKRFRNRSDIDMQPPKKKFETDNMNETIIVVSDDESEPPVIQINDLVKNSSQTKKKNNIPKAKSRRRSKRLQEQRINMKKAMSDNCGLNNDEKDIAVIWSSTSGYDTNEHTNITERKSNCHNEQPLFFIDTSGDKSNYKKEILHKDSSRVQKARQNQSHVKKKAKNKRIQPNVGKSKKKSKGRLREIIVDGSNIAYGYSCQQEFSKVGLQLVLDYFNSRGHSVKIFLPQHLRKKGREYLENWYRRGNVIFTPSRNIGGKNIVPYDDRFIVDYATKCNGIIVTSDQYRDLWNEKPEWRETIEKRLITPTFVGNYVMFPEDPLGRLGPTLEEFLKH